MTGLEYVVLTTPLLWLMAYAAVQANDRRQQAKFDRHVEQALKIAGPTGDYWCERCADLVHDPIDHLKEHAKD